MLVSSANKIGTDLPVKNFGKSFMCKRKNNGPKTEPWGTPCSVLAQDDVIVCHYTVMFFEICLLGRTGRDCNGYQL